eukprot:scaffold16350_cov61-Phaeocystis_antarctica.AAC.3
MSPARRPTPRHPPCPASCVRRHAASARPPSTPDRPSRAGAVSTPTLSFRHRARTQAQRPPRAAAPHRPPQPPLAVAAAEPDPAHPPARHLGCPPRLRPAN